MISLPKMYKKNTNVSSSMYIHYKIIFNPATFSCLSQTRPGFSLLYLVVFLCSMFQDERWLFVSLYPFHEKKSTKSDDQHSSIIYKYLSPQTNSSTQKIPWQMMLEFKYFLQKQTLSDKFSCYQRLMDDNDFL